MRRLQSIARIVFCIARPIWSKNHLVNLDYFYRSWIALIAIVSKLSKRIVNKNGATLASYRHSPTRSSLFLLVIAVLALSGCTSFKPAPVSSRSAVQPVEIKGDYTVKKGETLYSIAVRNKLNYHDLADINGIPEPYTIYPGQQLRFSRKVVVTPPVIRPKPQAQPEEARRPLPERYKNAVYNAKPVQEKVAKPTADAVNIGWVWPANGTIIGRFSDQGSVNKGVDLAGKRGEPVFAAADGTVVYSGPGIVGYGNLIIIKHNDIYLSAYAHNSRLLVQEGNIVKAGQVIAEIGSSGTQRDKLHFEIRKYGRPVDPLQYLPKR